MRRAHGLVGLLFLIVFPLTGAYMRMQEVSEMDPGPRMMFRASHLYLLFAGLLNLLAFSSVDPELERGRLRQLGSALLLLAPFVLLAGFALEPAEMDVTRPVSRWGIYGAALGSVLLAWPRRRRKD